MSMKIIAQYPLFILALREICSNDRLENLLICMWSKSSKLKGFSSLLIT